MHHLDVEKVSCDSRMLQQVAPLDGNQLSVNSRMLQQVDPIGGSRLFVTITGSGSGGDGAFVAMGGPS